MGRLTLFCHPRALEGLFSDSSQEAAADPETPRYPAPLPHITRGADLARWGPPPRTLWWWCLPHRRTTGTSRPLS